MERTEQKYEEKEQENPDIRFVAPTSTLHTFLRLMVIRPFLPPLFSPAAAAAGYSSAAGSTAASSSSSSSSSSATSSPDASASSSSSSDEEELSCRCSSSSEASSTACRPPLAAAAVVDEPGAGGGAHVSATGRGLGRREGEGVVGNGETTDEAGRWVGFGVYGLARDC